MADQTSLPAAKAAAVPLPATTETTKSGDSKKGVVYDLQTHWKDLHIPTFVATSSAFYLAEQLVGHPLEVIRTRLQVDQKKVNFAALKDFFKAQGAKSLFVGFWPGTIGYLPGNAVYFLTYSFAKDKLQDVHNYYRPDTPQGAQVPWVSFTAGMAADVAAISLYCPVEVVVQRLMIQDQQKKLYANSFDAVRKIAQQEGLRAFYKGFGTILLNSLPASAIWWTIYEQFKTTASRMIDQHQHQADAPSDAPLVVHKHKTAQVLGGALAGAVISVITNPLDVIRTRLQTQDIFHNASGVHANTVVEAAGEAASPVRKQEMYRNTFDAARKIYFAEGYRAFAKGLGPRAASWIIASGFGAILYEFVVDLSTIKK